MRLRAIWCCVWFGLLPWQLYEDSCHYGKSRRSRNSRRYVGHAWLNIKTAVTWIVFREPQDWRDFETEVNPSWRSVWSDMFRPCR